MSPASCAWYLRPSGTELFIPLAGVIDLEKERLRLRDEAARLECLADGTERRLGNPGFTGKAPPEVVEREREKLNGYREQVQKLRGKLASLEGAA